MAFWDADMTTRMGAESAADNGGLACWIKAGFMVLGVFIFGGMAGFDTLDGQVIMAILSVQVVIFIIAGFRLRAGKGAFWGIGAAVLLVLGMIETLMMGAFGGIIINIVFLVMIVQGIRGALALRKGEFYEEEAEVFE